MCSLVEVEEREEVEEDDRELVTDGRTDQRITPPLEMQGCM